VWVDRELPEIFVFAVAISALIRSIVDWRLVTVAIGCDPVWLVLFKRVAGECPESERLLVPPDCIRFPDTVAPERTPHEVRRVLIQEVLATLRELSEAEGSGVVGVPVNTGESRSATCLPFW
jgi:hypothetical protein